MNAGVCINRFIAALLISGLALGCGKKSKCPPRNIEANEMPGSWTDARPRTDQMFAGTRYDIVFTQDSFRMRLRHWTDAIGTDSCGAGEFNEYTAGHYTFDRSTGTTELTGVYTDQAYQPKTSGCHTIGDYHHFFKVQKKCDTLILNEKGNLAPNMIIRLYPN